MRERITEMAATTATETETEVMLAHDAGSRSSRVIGGEWPRLCTVRRGRHVEVMHR